MCHLCHKMEALQGFEHITVKPILRLFAKLHKHVEPRLGDLWLWRHVQTSSLKKHLEALHKLAPSKLLKTLIDDVDHELEHIKKNMVDHPPRKSTGRWEALKTSVAPSESSSSRIKKEIVKEEEKSRPKIQSSLWRKVKPRDSRDRLGTEKRIPMPKDPASLPEFSSDIDPPLPRIQQSIRLVEAWLKRCNEVMGVEAHRESDNESMVSFLGGGLLERPKLDVDVWKFSRRSWKSRSSTSTSNIGSASSYRLPTTQLSNCVFDKPLHKLELDSGIVGAWLKLVSSKASRQKYQSLVESLILKKKAEKLGKARKITVAQAMDLLNARGRRKERANMMSGGRSPRPLPRKSMETVAANTSQGRTSLDSSIPDEVELTPSETQRCIRKAEAGLKNEDNSDTASLPSSRPSAVNLGSVLNQSSPGHQCKNQAKDSVKITRAAAGQKKDEHSDTTSTLNTRLSAVNFGSVLNQSREFQQSQNQISVPSSVLTPSSRNSTPKYSRPTTPTAIGRAPSPPIKVERPPRLLNRPAKASVPLRRETRHLPGHQSVGSEDVGISKALQNSRRRRAERNEHRPVIDGYRLEERKQHWSPNHV